MPGILVVDDSATERESVARILRHEGYAVTPAANGKEAWLMLYAGAPDLIVLDLLMPQMGGLKLLELLREHHHWNQVRVLILTGHADEEHLLEQARALGVDRIFFKGCFTVEEFVRCVRELVPVAEKATLSPRERGQAAGRGSLFLPDVAAERRVIDEIALSGR